MNSKLSIFLIIISFLFIFLIPSFASAAPILTIKDVSDSPDPFSPNGDGIEDVTAISATISASGFTHPVPWLRRAPRTRLFLVWRLTIRNSRGRLIRRFIHRRIIRDNSEARISQTWDGKDYRRRVVPDDKYTYRIDARIRRIRARPGYGDVTVSCKVVDNTPPSGTIKINNGALYTNSTQVTLTLSATDDFSGVNKMQFSNDGTDWSTPEDYTTSTSKSWTLSSGDGTKTVYAKFKDGTGNWSEPVSDTIILDTAPPVVNITSPADGAVISVSPISVSGTIDDNDATVTINGEVAIVSSGQFSVDNIGLTLGNNTITATATDLAGNSSSSSITVTYDNTPPTTPTVTDDGTYTTSLTELHATWVSQDSETGIAEYQYSIGTSISATNVVPWTSAGTNTKVTYTGLSLTQGQTYYFNVKAINGASIESNEGYSNGITVESTKPVSAIVIDDGEYTTSSTELHAYWTSADPESGIIEYQYSIGTTPGATDVVNWTSASTNTEVTHTNLYLNHGQIYYFNVKAKNDAHIWSDISSSDGIMVNVHIPVINGITPQDNSTFFTQTQVIISVYAQDDDGDSLEYRFLVDDKIEQDWSTYSSYEWTALPTTTLIRKITCQVRDDKEGQVLQDVNYNIEIDTNDITPPTTPIVTTDEYSNSLTSLHASWISEDRESGIVEFQYAIGTFPGDTDVVNWTSASPNTEMTHYGLELIEGQDYYFSVKATNGVGLEGFEGYSSADNASKEVILKITSPQDNAIITESEFTIEGIVKGTDEITINNKPVTVNEDGTFTGPILIAPGYAKRQGIGTGHPDYIIMSYPGSTTITATAYGQSHSIRVYYYQLFVKRNWEIVFPLGPSGNSPGYIEQAWNMDLFEEPPFSSWENVKCNSRVRDFNKPWSYFNSPQPSSFYKDSWWEYFTDGNGNTIYVKVKDTRTSLTLHTLPAPEGKIIPMVLVFEDCTFAEMLGPGPPYYQPVPLDINGYIINGQSLRPLYGEFPFGGSGLQPNACYIILKDYPPDTDIILTAGIPCYTPGLRADSCYLEKYFSFDSINLLRLDLIVDGMSEDEETESAEMRINANYDEENKTGQKDDQGNDIYFEDFRVNDYIVANDLNLLSGQLDITGVDIEGKYQLIYPQDKIIIWKENDDGTYSKIESDEFYPVTLPVHYNLKIEAIDGSKKTNDVRIIARFIPDRGNYGGDYDFAFLTVIETKFMLTFDDGPYPSRTDNVLSALENFYVNGQRVKAAFFEVGLDGSESAEWDLGTQGSVHNYPNITRNVDNSNHIVGNHTQHHQWFKWVNPLTTIEEKIKEVKEEILDCESEIRTALGKEPVKLFRTPYLEDDEPEVNGAIELDYSLIWGELTGDVFRAGILPPRLGSPTLEEVKDNTEEILEKWNTKEKPNNKKGEPCVLIFHDTRPVTSSNIAEIISNIQDRGFVLVDFDDAQLNTQITRP